jgi:rubrerythrin
MCKVFSSKAVDEALERVECGKSCTADAELIRAYIDGLRKIIEAHNMQIWICQICHKPIQRPGDDICQCSDFDDGVHVVAAPSAVGYNCSAGEANEGCNVCGYCGMDAR